MIVNPDFRELLRSLNDKGVRYLVVGGYAVALHGHPRFTKDIDLWIDRTESNAERLLAALDAFGFGGLGITVEDFLEEDQIIQLGRPPNRVDFLTSVPGVEFDTCYAQRVTLDADGLPVTFIGLEGLRMAKQASGRLQDLADLEGLEDGSEA